MKQKNNSQFAHKTTLSNIENFYKIMSGEKKIITKKDKLEWEGSYFAMCLLLPKEFFLQIIEFLGGIETVKSDRAKKACLARTFNVEYRLVETRINDLFPQEKHDTKKKTKSKTTNHL